MKEWEIDLLRFCLKQWDILSNNPDRYDCMADHCHIEMMDAQEILDRYSKENEKLNNS